MPEQHIDNEKIPTRLIGAIVAVGSLAFIGILTETVMTVLFPALMREFHVDTATVQWITTIYLLAVAATMPISSFLKRRFALKTIFLAAVILAIVGSLIMIVAQAFPLLIVARIIQGIGSGVATPLMINIILEQSPRSKIGRLMGVGSLVITVAPAIGPTVGGAVTTVLPWRAIFVIAIPLVLIAACIGMKCIEQKTPTEAAYLDPIQLGSIVVALVGLVLALNQGGVAIGVRQVSHTLRHYRHCQSDCGPRLVDRVRHEFQACLLPAAAPWHSQGSRRTVTRLRISAAAIGRHRLRLCHHQCGTALARHHGICGRLSSAARRTGRRCLCPAWRLVLR